MRENSYYATPAAQVATPVSGELAASVLRNTYMLLGMSLAFSAAMAWYAMSAGISFINPWLVLGVYFGALIFTNVTRNSAWGILGVFAITGWLGFTTGPIIGMFMQSAAGSQIVSMALASTATIFVVMSGIALVTKKDFSGLSNFLMVGLLVAFLCGIGAMIFDMPALSLAVSGAFVLLSSMLIMWQTSAIIHGGETNYIMATVTLFVSIYNLFMSLLHILSALGGDD